MSSNSQRSSLAKLMATENITVEHRNIPTAGFDVKNRVLGRFYYRYGIRKEIM